MRYSLRTLLIVMLLGGPACAWGRQRWEAYQRESRFAEAQRRLDSIPRVPRATGLFATPLPDSPQD